MPILLLLILMRMGMAPTTMRMGMAPTTMRRANSGRESKEEERTYSAEKASIRPANSYYTSW